MGYILWYKLRMYKITNTFYFFPTIRFTIKDMKPIDGATDLENWKEYCYELCLFNYAIAYDRIKEINN